MSVYALIINGAVQDLFTPPPGQTIDTCFPAAMSWVDVSTAVPPPLRGWTAVETNGTWSFTPPQAPAGPTVQQQATTALVKSDETLKRVQEAVSLGLTSWAATDVVTFMTYRRTLRGIMNGTASPMPTALPTQPAFPAGT